jgi:putative membrane protein
MMHYYRFGAGMPGSGIGIIACIIGFILFVAFVTLLVVLIVKVVKNRGHMAQHMNDMAHGSHQGRPSAALDILNDRYAKGEIGDEEYQKKKAEITKY